MAKQNSYFTSMVAQRGPEWLMTLRPDEIQNATKKIVRDMAKGVVDYERFGSAFLDPKFMENLLIGLSNELESNTFNYNGCSMLLAAYPQTPNLPQHVAHLSKVVYAYNLVRNKLLDVKASGNIGYLIDISGMLYNDRMHLV
jgi:hypothetical protein